MCHRHLTLGKNSASDPHVGGDLDFQNAAAMWGLDFLRWPSPENDSAIKFYSVLPLEFRRPLPTIAHPVQIFKIGERQNRNIHLGAEVIIKNKTTSYKIALGALGEFSADSESKSVNEFRLSRSERFQNVARNE